MMRALLRFSLLGMAALMLLPAQAHADSITLTLTQPFQVGAGHLGGTLSFNAMGCGSQFQRRRRLSERRHIQRGRTLDAG
jgi:hypothetical protein